MLKSHLHTQTGYYGNSIRQAIFTVKPNIKEKNADALWEVLCDSLFVCVWVCVCVNGLKHIMVMQVITNVVV